MANRTPDCGGGPSDVNAEEPKRDNRMTPPDDVGEIAEALLADGEAPVLVRTVAARVHYRRLLINRGPSPTETLRRLYALRRGAVADLARWWL